MASTNIDVAPARSQTSPARGRQPRSSQYVAKPNHAAPSSAATSRSWTAAGWFRQLWPLGLTSRTVPSEPPGPIGRRSGGGGGDSSLRRRPAAPAGRYARDRLGRTIRHERRSVVRGKRGEER